MKYFSDKLMSARSNDDADLIDEYRNIIKSCRDYIEAMQSLHAPDPAGLGLNIINRIDRIL